MKSLNNIIIKSTRRKDRKDTKKEKILAGLSYIIVFCFLATTMVIASYYLTTRLSEFGQTYAFINIVLLMNFLLLFAKSVFESLNVLYFSKDLRLLLRMPIKSKDIIHAKLFNMIISEYEMETIMLGIPMIVFGILTNVGIMFYMYMFAILLILPVIPIVITTLIISIIMSVTNNIKNKTRVMYITIILALLIVGIITGMFNTRVDISSSSFERIMLQANGLAENIADSFVLIKPIMNSLLNYNNIDGLKNVVIYVIESVICYVGALFIMAKVYLKGAIGTTINSNKKINKESHQIMLKDVKQKNKYKSYISKELKILIRTPIFLIQCVIMPIAFPIIVFLIMMAFMNFVNNTGVNILSQFYEILNKSFGQVIFFIFGQIFYMFSFSSIIAISKESKNSILTKYIPISLNKQFSLKILIGVLINSITSILVTISYYFCTKDVSCTFIILISLILLNTLGEKFKILIDLKNPRMSWDNEYTMMKQNTNVMYELFYTLLVICVLVAVSFIVSNVAFFLIVMLALLIIVNTAISEYVYKKQNQLFEKIF